MAEMFQDVLKKEMARKKANKELEKSVSEAINRPAPLPYKRFDQDLPALYKEDEGNAGFDLFARLDQEVVLEPGECATIPLNVATIIPSGHVGLLFQRSSTFRKWGVKLTNGVGVIDSTFSGPEDEYGAEFLNSTTRTIRINSGDKICQVVFLALANLLPVEKENLTGENRGGFGTSFDHSSAIEKEKINEPF